MSEELSLFFAALHTARSFEEAAQETLRAMLRHAAQTLEASALASKGRLLRGVVHLRPEGIYQRLVVREQEPARPRPASASSAPATQELALLASASAWRAVVEHGCAVAIDVGLRRLQPLAGAPAGVRLLPPSEASFPQESQRRMLGRQATHVGVFPLRVPGGRIDGMISLEAECMAALGLEDFLWKEAGGFLQLLADVAASWLAALPPRPAASGPTDPFLPVVGQAMAQLLPLLRIFAQQEETLLISGPTGAGKSRLARWCHENSGRRQGHFESLDLMTVPEELQMAELFGWRKGAFTGAVRDNPGSIARAEGGTLFIDEIDKLSLKAQAGLLQVLEARTYRMLGEASGEQRAQVRFIIGTNANLKQAVRRGTFREDLYYRINVLPLRVPPLDERKDELALWGRYMVERRHQESSPGGSARLTAEAAQALERSAWPGNLRQLDNIIRRAYTLAMVEQGGAVSELVLHERHVRQALDYEGGMEGPHALVGALCHAARAFLQEAQRREAPLDIDLAECFRGFVLGTAVREVGKDEAFRLVGREALVKGRNHHKALRRELEKVELLCQEVGRARPEFLEQLSLPLEE